MRYAVRPSLCPSSNCSIRALTLAAIASFEVCGFCVCCCLRFWINGVTVGVVVMVAVFMGASSCWAVALAVAVNGQVAGTYMPNASWRRAGVARRNGEGYLPPVGREKRVIFRRKIMRDIPCAARGAEPLPCLFYGVK